MKIELADVISCGGGEISEQVEIGLKSFDSRLGRYPIVKKEPFAIRFANEGGRMEEMDFMAGTSLDVDQLIFGEILVSWPMKVLCREDCKGICKKCGANMNLAGCQCPKAELDPRMAAIQDIFNQCKEV